MDEFNITGKWINKNTGEELYVKNNIIDGDQMILITNKGTISLADFSNNYISVSDEIYDESGNVIGHDDNNTTVVKPQSKPSPVKKVQTIDDQEYLIKDQVVTVQSTLKNTATKKETKKIPANIDTDYSLVEKLFNKVKSKPIIDLKIEWDDLPVEQILTLVNFLDININDISTYIYNTYFNEDEIKEKINETIKNKINNINKYDK